MVLEPDRSPLNFERSAREAFAFLGDLGYSEIAASPTLVRYGKGDIEVDVYHGRQSYEIGAGIAVGGTRYSMSALIRAADPALAARSRNYVATTPEGVTAGLKALADLLKRYGARALSGDVMFFAALDRSGALWSQEYALDVLAEQLRPRAAAAFRARDYSTAAGLYAQVRSRLSPAEIKKLAIAEARSRRST